MSCTRRSGWASGSHPGIAAITRYFAVAAAAATGMRFADPDVLASVAAGGASAFGGVVNNLVPRHKPGQCIDRASEWMTGANEP